MRRSAEDGVTSVRTFFLVIYSTGILISYQRIFSPKNIDFVAQIAPAILGDALGIVPPDPPDL